MNPKTRTMTAVYLTSGEEILLLYRKGGRVVSEVWTGSAGGHMEPQELNDPCACVLREMKEELNLDPDEISSLSLRYITLRMNSGELRQNYFFFAQLNDRSRHLDSTEGICRWFSMEEIADLPMPVSARHVMDHYLSIGKTTQDLYVCITEGSTTHIAKLA